MKIAYLADANSIHTQKWVKAFTELGNDVHLITMHPEKFDTTATMYELPVKGGLGYYANFLHLKRLLKQIKPDLFHVHYASGYGTLGRLAGYQPTILSVWGSDVYDFPNESKMNARILDKNLKFAKWICSTSEAMAEHTKRVCPDIKDISITPFGVDISKFRPIDGLRDEQTITIGTVKTLAPKYGIDVLIRGFAHLINDLSDLNLDVAKKLRLMIVGGGPLKDELVHLADELGVSDAVEFVGVVAHEQVPEYLNKFDVYVAASRLDSESFGVAVVEASSCGVPVVVSNVGGLPEVVNHGETGYVVPPENVEELSTAMRNLVLDADLRKRMSVNGRQWVMEKYDWQESVQIMKQVYETICPSA